MKNKKLEYVLLFHLVFLLVLIALQLPFLTGVVAHEIIFIVFLACLGVHIFCCRKMYASTLTAIAKKPNGLAIAQFAIVIALGILVILQIVSFIMTSTVIFGAANIAFNSVWYSMYIWVSNLILVGVVALLAVNLKSIATFFDTQIKHEEPKEDTQNGKNEQQNDENQE